MLYLSRKSGESIIINETIEMTVVEIKGKSVKLGFNFPDDASVLRKELYDKIHEQNIAAMGSLEGDMMDDLSFDPVDVIQKQQTSPQRDVEDEEGGNG